MSRVPTQLAAGQRAAAARASSPRRRQCALSARSAVGVRAKTLQDIFGDQADAFGTTGLEPVAYGEAQLRRNCKIATRARPDSADIAGRSWMSEPPQVPLVPIWVGTR